MQESEKSAADLAIILKYEGLSEFSMKIKNSFIVPCAEIPLIFTLLPSVSFQWATDLHTEST